VDSVHRRRGYAAIEFLKSAILPRDAILKSQSLSNHITYHGYNFQPISNPPYSEGVFDHLHAASLVFNFNTVGTGHWIDRVDGRSVFALNRTGSFSVTYLAGATGQTSTIPGSNAAAEAEGVYTDWFNASENKTLARTVQWGQPHRRH
jgi:hypothetical protein